MRAINCAAAVSSLRSIRAHGRYDDDGDGDGVRVSSHYAQTNYVGSGVKNVKIITSSKIQYIGPALLTFMGREASP